MERKLLLRIAGPVWELARYFLVIALVAAGSSSAAGSGVQFRPWLTAAAAGGLVMPAAFFMLSLDPKHWAAYLPLVKLGKVLEIATSVVLLVTAAIGSGMGMPPLGSRLPEVGRTLAVFIAVLVADAAVLSGLLRVPAGKTGPSRR